jgi:hypothetical protein
VILALLMVPVFFVSVQRLVSRKERDELNENPANPSVERPAQTASAAH